MNSIGILLKIVCGLIPAGTGLILFIPGLAGLYFGDEASDAFFLIGSVCSASGLLVLFLTRNISVEVKFRATFAAVTLSWLAVCMIGAIPYSVCGVFSSYIDSFFESTSGFTTTGSSVLTDIEAVEKSVLLWRAMTQFLGGAGIIIFFIALLPILGVGAVQLIRTEMASSHRGLAPHARDAAVRVFAVYSTLNIVEAALLVWAGMPVFDAITTAMCTISTAGFSIRNAGIAAYNNPVIDYVVIVFMFLGALNFSLLYNLFVRLDRSMLRDTELRAFFTIFFIAALSMAYVNWGPVYANFSDSFRYSLFSVVTIGSTTGFTHQNYLNYPPFCQFILVLIMVMGGMSGSTAGGMKCVRVVAAFKLLVNELKQVIHPHGVYVVKLNGRAITEKVARTIWALLFIHLLVSAALTAILTMQGADIVTASTAAFEVLSTVGPGLGKIGPLDNFAWFPDLSKLALSVGMLLGRLEFLSILVLITPSYWKRY